METRHNTCTLSRAALVLFLLFGQGLVGAQNLPTTRVWLADINAGVPAQPVLISAETGYNNQPLFSADGKMIFYTAEREGGQTDIARYELATGNLDIVAGSPESEYSPTPIPGQAALSVVRVEADGRQRLWRLDLRNGDFSLLLPNVEPVGYHSWYAEDKVALFVLGDSFTLHKAFVGDQPSRLVFDNIGRTLRGRPPTGHVLFVDRNTVPWSIAIHDMQHAEARTVMALYPDVEDFEVDHKGRFWMGSGSKLYRGDPVARRWSLAADLSEFGIGTISRLGISPDGTRLAIVDNP